jgi:hypothetical protein
VRTAFVALFLAGCSRGPDRSGEEWALKTLGDGARQLKSQTGGPPTGDAAGEFGEPYAPRPLVVIEYVSQIPEAEGDPCFHPINATLSAGLVAGAVEDVKSLVVVRKIICPEKAGTIKIKRRTQTLWANKPAQIISIVAKNEDGRYVTVAGDMIEGHEDEALRAFLDKLPEAPPER